MYTIDINPTKIGIVKVPDYLIPKEEEEYSMQDNKYNKFSTESYILNREGNSALKNFIENQIRLYAIQLQGELCSNIELYVTQSWINISKCKEKHQEHHHPNSIISGVLYLKTSNKDNITFNISNPNTLLLNIFTMAPNLPFSDRIGNIARGDLLLFPSTLPHKVEEVEEAEGAGRVSLAFNSFVRGVIGTNNSLMELKL